MQAHTHDGRKFRMLNVIDEYTRECLAIRVARKLKAVDVIDVLSDLFISANETCARVGWSGEQSPCLGPL